MKTRSKGVFRPSGRGTRGQRRTFAVLAGAAAVALGLAACSSGTPAGQTTNGSASGPITIGFAAGLSGVMEPYESPALKGAQIAVDQINAKGGVLGRKLKIVTADTGSDINASTTTGKKILDEGADVVITSIDLNFGGGTASVAAAAGKVAMSIGGGSDGWGKLSPLVFSMGTSATSDSAAMAKWSSSKGYKSAYLLIDTSTDYAKEVCSKFGDDFTKAGGTVAGSDTFSNGDSSVAAQVTKIKSLPNPPDVIALCSYPPGGALVVKSLRASGVDSPLVGPPGMAGDYWFKQTIPNLSDFYVVDWVSIWGDDPSPAINTLTKDFRSSGIDVQNSYGVMGYAAVNAFAKGIEKAGTTDGRALAKAMSTFKDVEVPFSLSFTPDFHMDQSREYRVIGVTNGKPGLVGTVTPTP